MASFPALLHSYIPHLPGRLDHRRQISETSKGNQRAASPRAKTDAKTRRIQGKQRDLSLRLIGRRTDTPTRRSSRWVQQTATEIAARPVELAKEAMIDLRNRIPQVNSPQAGERELRSGC